MRSSVLGLFIGIGIVYYAVVNASENNDTYMNFMSMVIVFGGSISVAIITHGLKNTSKLFSLFFKAFSTATYTNLNVVEELVSISKDIYNGKKSIGEMKNETVHPFCMDGLRLIENKIEISKLKKIMLTMLSERQESHNGMLEQLETLAKYPPAFGMMGTIIGLVAVLNQLDSSGDISKIGPSMAVALITTLYGIFLSNYVIQPIGDNLNSRTQKDMKIRRIIVEAIVLISKNEDPIYVRENLLGFLTPKEREEFRKRNQSPHNETGARAA